MKIAFFTDTYLPNTDGVVVSIVNFKRELEKEGHEVYVFASGSQKAKKENGDGKVFYYDSATFTPYPQYKVALFPFFSFQKVQSLGIDVVHSHGLATMGLAAAQSARSLRLPSVETFHTLVTEATHYISRQEVVKKTTSRMIWEYLKWYLPLFDSVTCPSNYIGKMLESHGVKSEVLPNGIDTSRFVPGSDGNAFRQEYKIDDKKQVVLYLGRVAFEKNLELLINSAPLALREDSSSLFVVAGTGPALEHYRHLVKKKGLSDSFVFTGFVPDALLPSAYSAASVFAFPSKFETQGLVALEAMASGVPVVACKQSAASDFVEPGKNGWLFNDTPEDCASAIVKCAERKQDMSAAARATAEQYSVEKCTGRLLRVYEKVLDGRKKK
jgi:1,2-diacylglycerol 3-alpha-glucosyltransferase